MSEADPKVETEEKPVPASPAPAPRTRPKAEPEVQAAASDPVAAAGAAAAAQPEAPVRKRGPLRLILMLSVPLILLLVGGYFYLTSGRYVSTDNAYVQQDMVSVAPEVQGVVTEVLVHENQQVRRGQLLFRIDPRPFRIALAQAEAQIAAALDEPGLLEPVDHPAKRDRLDVQRLGKIDLPRAVALALEMGEHPPLRLGRAQHGRALVRLAANQPGGLDDLEGIVFHGGQT